MQVFDYFILSGVLFDESIKSIDVSHDGDNLSDHDPVFMKLCLDNKYIGLSDKVRTNRAAWYKASASDLNNYNMHWTACLITLIYHLVLLHVVIIYAQMCNIA